MSFISILMPVKNAAPWLTECLQSIALQEYTNWELIAVDDHSDDHSLDILEYWEEIHTSVRVFSNNGNGIVDALSLAYQNANGNWITRMDADDRMPLNKLSLFASALSSSNENTVVTGLVHYFSDESVSEGYRSYEKWLNERCSLNDHWNHVYRECILASANWLTNRNNIDRIGGFKGLQYPEDYNMVLKWYQSNLSIVSIPEITHFWREHPKRTSRNSEYYQQTSFFQLKLNHFIEHEYDKNKDLVIWGTGRKGKLTASIMIENKVDFKWMDQSSMVLHSYEDYPVVSYQSITQLGHPQVLICVYPENEIRIQLESFLQDQNLNLGVDYWFL